MYPITMSITIHSAAQLEAVHAAVIGAKPANLAPETTKPEQAQAKKPAPAATEKTEPAATPSTATAPESAATKSVETSDESPASNEAKTFTLEDAKTLIMKIVQDKGRDAAVALLDKYGVKVAAKLAAEQVSDFCTEAEKVLA